MVTYVDPVFAEGLRLGAVRLLEDLEAPTYRQPKSKARFYVRIKIDDEIQWVIGGSVSFHNVREGGEPHVISQVLRGQEGTIAAPHEAGAEITFLTD